jgi:PAS domain S-box-containing protein
VREGEKRIRAILDNVVDGIITIDQQGTIESFNPAACNIFGYSPAEVVGQNIKMLMPEPYQGQHDTYIRNYLDGGQAKIIGIGREVTGLRKDGSIFPMELAVGEIGLGQRRLFTGIVRDITERKRAEEALVATLDRTTSLFLASRTLISADRVSELLQRVVEIAGGTLSASQVVLYLFDLDRRAVIDVVKGGSNLHQVPTVTFDELQQGLSGWVMQELKPAFSPKEQPDPRESPAVQKRRLESNCGDIIVVPLLYRDKLLGTLTAINQYDQGDFSDEDVEFLAALGNQAAVTIENARLIEVLRDSEARYRDIVEDQTELIGRFQPTGTLTVVNDAYCHYFDRAREELVGHSFMSLMPEKDRQVVEQKLASLTSAKPVITYEHQVIGRTGEIRWQEWTGRVLFDGHNRILEFQAAGRDITQRKHVEQALAEERNLLRILIDNIPDYIFVKDDQSHFVINNRAHIQILGATKAEDLTGKTDFDCFPQELATKYYADEQTIVNTGQSLINREEVTRDPLGHRKWLLTTKVPLRNSLGEIRGIVGISRDISQRKQAEERQARLLKELANANQDLKDFAYIVSHDLKAPLRAIGSISSWLRTDYLDKLDEEGQELVELLMIRVKRMEQLIDGVLQYSRVGREKEDIKEIDLARLVPEVVEFVAPPANIEVKIETELPSVWAEPTRIGQVFQNLLSNAVKFMDKPQGKISISCVEAEDYWKFSIADNGPGINQKYFGKIFQIFQTLTARDELESSGVGLSVVKKIVELYGGQIWLESTPGNGTIFYFTLPQQYELNLEAVAT